MTGTLDAVVWEVYRARDSRLNRDEAVKVLPVALDRVRKGSLGSKRSRSGWDEPFQHCHAVRLEDLVRPRAVMELVEVPRLLMHNKARFPRTKRRLSPPDC